MPSAGRGGLDCDWIVVGSAILAPSVGTVISECPVGIIEIYVQNGSVSRRKKAVLFTICKKSEGK